eukprot:6967906-Alexandrium_andersonii.AAC.1
MRRVRLDLHEQVWGFRRFRVAEGSLRVALPIQLRMAQGRFNPTRVQRIFARARARGCTTGVPASSSVQ